VNEFLVVYLDSIDERLLEYLDHEGEESASSPTAPEHGKGPTLVTASGRRSPPEDVVHSTWQGG
jgi:hypothetical protein